ncbi:MAG: ATP-binding cassette domain-containing protein [Armatimonadota bacterium]|nr:ATP-binding cassette domain-containing protein [Armatimonadota bacterium]MDR5697598.1 ATP-binding cassette domain-containing protein [Armatimonadota bacterium]
MINAIELHDVRKEYPKRRQGVWPFRGGGPQTLTAVDGVTLHVPQGEFFGLLGPNGAGKTTIVRMICTLLEPTSGTVRVLGYDAVRRPADVRARLGAVLTGERSVYWKLSGRENLEYFAALYGVPPRQTRGRIEEVLSRVDLADRADELVERYSHGMRQRLILARALLPDPPLLVLDEPTIGLDPQAARNLRDLLRELHRAGKTVLLTTHYMEEADQLCQRVGIIDRGRIIALDTPVNLKRGLSGTKAIELEAVGGDGSAARALRAIPGVEQVAHDQGAEGVVRYRVLAAHPRAVLASAVGAVSADGARLQHVRVAEPTLEDVFLALTGRTLREEVA